MNILIIVPLLEALFPYLGDLYRFARRRCNSSTEIFSTREAIRLDHRADFRGTASRIAQDATAFPLCRDHMNVNVVAGWEIGGDSTPHIEWVKRTTERLSSLAIPGGYVALLGPNDRQRVRDFYGEAVQRLLAVKARVDPNNLFRSNVGQL